MPARRRPTKGSTRGKYPGVAKSKAPYRARGVGKPRPKRGN